MTVRLLLSPGVNSTPSSLRRVNSAPSSLRRELVQPESTALPDPLEYCTFASHLRWWDRKICIRNVATRQAAAPLQDGLGQRDLRNRKGTEGLAWWPCAARRELLEPPNYGRPPRKGFKSKDEDLSFSTILLKDFDILVFSAFSNCLQNNSDCISFHSSFIDHCSSSV